MADDSEILQQLKTKFLSKIHHLTFISIIPRGSVLPQQPVKERTMIFFKFPRIVNSLPSLGVGNALKAADVNMLSNKHAFT